ncbi:MAG: protein translocase subunit SecF [Synergistes sp.]|nr:protein translocase subunit SecF [Synergistes sp.]
MATFDASKLNFKFMNYRHIFVGISLFFIAASFALLLAKGINFGVDFTGGLLLQVKFEEKTADVAAVREALAGIGQGGATIQALDNNDIMLRFQAEDEQIRKDVLNVLQEKIGPLKVMRVDKIGPVVGSELRTDAAVSLVLALIGILIYMAYRFRFRFGAVAVAALMHDVIIMLGAYSLTGKEVSVTFIAAILTVAGYSLNDSIVVLDRIRENWSRVRSLGIEELVNTSVNQTLCRTINTSVTTLLPVIAMFIFGGEVISNFAFAFLVGIGVGTYSSIYVASSLLVEWYKRSPNF